MRSLHLPSIAAATIIGSLSVIGSAYLSAQFYLAPAFPVMAMLAGYIVAGLITGVLSKDETIVEPGIAAVMVSIAAFFALPAFNLDAFADFPASHLILVMLNGVILTFVGAWAGEYLQDGEVAGSHQNIQWGWILSGSTVGVAATMLLASLLSNISAIGAHLDFHFYAFLAGLLCTGMIVGWRSPGVTIKEAAIAGFVVVTLDIDIISVALGTVGFSGEDLLAQELTWGPLAGVTICLLGGFAGEKIQQMLSKKNT